MTKELMIGSIVRFVHHTENDTPTILQGKIKEKLKNNCLLLEVVNGTGIKNLNGTLCNRSMDKIVEG